MAVAVQRLYLINTCCVVLLVLTGLFVSDWDLYDKTQGLVSLQLAVSITCLLFSGNPSTDGVVSTGGIHMVVCAVALLAALVGYVRMLRQMVRCCGSACVSGIGACRCPMNGYGHAVTYAWLVYEVLLASAFVFVDAVCCYQMRHLDIPLLPVLYKAMDPTGHGKKHDRGAPSAVPHAAPDKPLATVVQIQAPVTTARQPSRIYRTKLTLKPSGHVVPPKPTVSGRG